MAEPPLLTCWALFSGTLGGLGILMLFLGLLLESDPATELVLLFGDAPGGSFHFSGLTSESKLDAEELVRTDTVAGDAVTVLSLELCPCWLVSSQEARVPHACAFPGASPPRYLKYPPVLKGTLLYLCHGSLKGL